jgi:hypothetical protein
MTVVPDKTVLISSTDIPYELELFSTIVESKSLSKPPVIMGASKQRVASGDSIVWLHSHFGRHQYKLKELNKSVIDCVEYDPSMNKKLLTIFSVYEVPKINKSGLTKKLLTVKEATDKLIKERAKYLRLGGNNYNEVIPEFKNYQATTDSAAYEYLMDTCPEFKKEQKALTEKVKEYEIKYPLLKVLSNRYLDGAQVKILITEIKKQLGE